MSVPSVGKIVLYALSVADAASVNKRRIDARAKMHDHQADASGAQIHVGSDVREWDICPLIVTKIHSDTCVSGQVMLDGNDVLWVSSRELGDAPGKFSWLVRT